MDDFNESIFFIDNASKQNAFIGVRVVRGKIGITISLRDDGDIAAFLPGSINEVVVETLNRALAIARNTDKDKESALQITDEKEPDLNLNLDQISQ